MTKYKIHKIQTFTCINLDTGLVIITIDSMPSCQLLHAVTT